MKTLTIWEAYLLAERYHAFQYEMQAFGWKYHKRFRQMEYFRNALTKRLQEQEEELELLRMYYGAEKEEGGSELHIYVATDKGKENVELIHSDCAKGDEEGVIGGSQDSQ